GRGSAWRAASPPRTSARRSPSSSPSGPPGSRARRWWSTPAPRPERSSPSLLLMRRNPFAAWAEAVVRRPWRVLALALALAAACAFPLRHFRIDTDLTSLLPDGAPAAEDYRAFLRTFGGFEKVFILVRAPGAPQLEGDAEPLL